MKFTFDKLRVSGNWTIVHKNPDGSYHDRWTNRLLPDFFVDLVPYTKVAHGYNDLCRVIRISTDPYYVKSIGVMVVDGTAKNPPVIKRGEYLLTHFGWRFAVGTRENMFCIVDGHSNKSLHTINCPADVINRVPVVLAANHAHSLDLIA